jgi:hypothetical protein
LQGARGCCAALRRITPPGEPLDRIFRRDYGDRRFDPGDPRTFRSDAAINLELGRLSPSAQRRYDEVTDRERRAIEDQLAEDAATNE